MKMLSFKNILGYCLSALVLVSSFSGQLQATDNLNVGIVNFKTCVEQSKLGKQEQTAFEAMKKQMETTLEEREKTLTEMANKFNNPDFLDSLSPEAEAKMKQDFRNQTQEFSQQQQQFFQALQQANMKILQKIAEAIAKAAEEVAKEKKIDIVVNEDSFFYYKPALDISIQVVAKMDNAFEKEAKTQK